MGKWCSLSAVHTGLFNSLECIIFARSYNQSIYQASDMGIAINMLPGDTQDLSRSSPDVLAAFPSFSSRSLCRPDLVLMFRLVGLHTSHLLQTPVAGSANGIPEIKVDIRSNIDEGYENIGEDEGDESSMPRSYRFSPSFDVLNCTGCFGHATTDVDHEQSSTIQTPLNLKGLLEAIRKGRVFLLNAFQVSFPQNCFSSLPNRSSPSWHSAVSL